MANNFKIKICFNSGISLVSQKLSEKDAKVILEKIARSSDFCTFEFNSEDWIIPVYGSEKSLVYFFPKREINCMTLVEREEK